MATDEHEARRDASHWYVRLREEADDPAVQADFRRWLEADPLHAEAWASMRDTMEVVARAPQALRVSAAAPARRPTRRARSTGRPLRAAGMAAAAGLAACWVVMAIPGLLMDLKADHVSASNRTERVRLDDGSQVELGPGSAIAVDYRGATREVRLLAGQAMFDVTPNPARPFKVATGDVTTTVLGTSFDVRRIGATTSVAVSHGHVRVEDSGADPRKTRELKAGGWVRIDDQHRVVSGTMAPELVGSWRRREVLAENQTIASVIDEIRPWYGGRIVLTDAALAARQVTGIYRLDDPAEALSLIVRPYGGRVTRITPWLLVVRPS
jgi:transmembrane sensor